MSMMEVVGLSNNVEKCRKGVSVGVFDGLFGVCTTVVDTFFWFFDDFRHYSMVFENFVGSDCFRTKLMIFTVVSRKKQWNKVEKSSENNQKLVNNIFTTVFQNCWSTLIISL